VINGVQASLYGSTSRYPYPRKAAAPSTGKEIGGRA
jgi:hypothetical protein